MKHRPEERRASGVRRAGLSEAMPIARSGVSRVYISGVPPGSAGKVERFLYNEYGCTAFYPVTTLDVQGYVAEFNAFWPQHELATLRDSLSNRFGGRFDVRYYEWNGRGAYAGESFKHARTVDIRGIPYSLVHDKSATDIAKHVFHDYRPVDARAFPSAGVIQITFQDAVNPMEIERMQGALQNEFRARGKSWGQNVMIERGADASMGMVPAWTPRGQTKTFSVPPGPPRPPTAALRRSSRRASKGFVAAPKTNLQWLLSILAFLLVSVTIFAMFGTMVDCTSDPASCPKSLCSTMGEFMPKCILSCPKKVKKLQKEIDGLKNKVKECNGTPAPEPIKIPKWQKRFGAKTPIRYNGKDKKVYYKNRKGVVFVWQSKQPVTWLKTKRPSTQFDAWPLADAKQVKGVDEHGTVKIPTPPPTPKPICDTKPKSPECNQKARGFDLFYEERPCKDGQERYILCGGAPAKTKPPKKQ